MANRLLCNFAVKIGAALATGVNRASGTGQPRRPSLFLNPILTRIGDIEGRVQRVELAPLPQLGPSVEEVAALGTLVSSQGEDIAGLRETMLRIEHRNMEQAEAFGQKVAMVEQHLPAHIESTVNTRIMELEQRLRGEFQEIHHQTVDAFSAAIENRVVNRIAALEHSLVEQSQSIVSLREKSLQTDENLQRLISAVERLCARAESQAQLAIVAPAPEPQVSETQPELQPEPKAIEPFEAHYLRALDWDAGAGRRMAPPRFALGTVGVAIAGLAFLGFRLFR